MDVCFSEYGEWCLKAHREFRVVSFENLPQKHCLQNRLPAGSVWGIECCVVGKHKILSVFFGCSSKIWDDSV